MNKRAQNEHLNNVKFRMASMEFLNAFSQFSHVFVTFSFSKFEWQTKCVKRTKVQKKHIIVPFVKLNKHLSLLPRLHLPIPKFKYKSQFNSAAVLFFRLCSTYLFILFQAFVFVTHSSSCWRRLFCELLV